MYQQALPFLLQSPIQPYEAMMHNRQLAVKPLTDLDEINVIFSDPWIAPKLTRDGMAPGYIDHPLVAYHGAYVGETLAGVFTEVRFTPWEREVHAALLRPALPHSRDLAHLFIAAMFADDEVTRLTANVFGTLPSAVNFIRKVGFFHEGTRRDACRVNGVLTDIVVLGLTRNDWLASRA